MATKKKSKVMAKATKVQPVPKGYNTVTPAITVRNATDAIEFYTKAFGAKEISRHYMPDGKTIMHASIKIGNSMFMLNDEMPEMNCKSPQSIGGSSTSFYVYVKDADKFFNQAVAAGATVTMPTMDAFWGDRMGQLRDPFGYAWSIATRKRNLSPKQLKEAREAWLAEMAKTPQQQQ